MFYLLAVNGFLDHATQTANCPTEFKFVCCRIHQEVLTDGSEDLLHLRVFANLSFPFAQLLKTLRFVYTEEVYSPTGAQPDQ